MTLVPHEPSEFEKQKHYLTHIPFQPWCTSCVKGKAQSEPHKRTARIIEDSELPVIQCDYLMLKDVAGTGGLAMEESKTIRNSCRDRYEQCWQQCKNTHTIQTIRKQRTDEMDCPTCSVAHSSFLR